MITCYLCEKRYIPGEAFNLYLCKDCQNRTSFCIKCDDIMMKIFEHQNMFKCGACKKICPAISKELIEMVKSIDTNSFLNISAINENLLTPKKNIINNNNANSIIYNNNSNLTSPNDIRFLNQLFGNKTTLNSPISPFFNDNKSKSNNNLQNINSSFQTNYQNNKNYIDINERNNNNNISNINNNNINNNYKKEENQSEDEKMNMSFLTDIDTSCKIKNRFHLDLNNNKKILNKSIPRIIDYFHINDSKIIDNSFNKNDFSGYNK